MGRRTIVDEQSLIEALKSGQISSASLDVFENEPSSRRQSVMKYRQRPHHLPMYPKTPDTSG
ncbi:NAD(P)-dependent oxidoreductase [Bifidobacterium dentium]|uniref:NAD(P)-dependent oxidoreductase n=1 Tax=Bifidobacterium dentium TaxID=1689 RepID=UPI0018C32B9A|nr:hypothetical protein [Bifidobacterium dentium]